MDSIVCLFYKNLKQRVTIPKYTMSSVFFHAVICNVRLSIVPSKTIANYIKTGNYVQFILSLTGKVKFCCSEFLISIVFHDII